MKMDENKAMIVVLLFVIIGLLVFAFFVSISLKKQNNICEIRGLEFQKNSGYCIISSQIVCAEKDQTLCRIEYEVWEPSLELYKYNGELKEGIINV